MQYNIQYVIWPFFLPKSAREHTAISYILQLPTECLCAHLIIILLNKKVSWKENYVGKNLETFTYS